MAAATAALPDEVQAAPAENSGANSSKSSKKKKTASDDGKVEVMKVTGIRSSLKESQEIKKLADNVIDAIVAEDIGKFPDENVAEALQRIPGVSVTRFQRRRPDGDSARFNRRLQHHYFKWPQAGL